jgi:hypothetical protein
MRRLRMKPLWATFDIVGMDKEIVEDDETLKGISIWKRSRQNTEGSQTNLNRPVEW